MSGIPFSEKLYALRPADRGAQLTQPFVRINTGAAAAAVVATGLISALAGRLLIPHTVVVICTPGAAQLINQISARIRSPDGAMETEFAALTVNPPLAAAVPARLSWSGSIIVPPGWSIIGRGEYSAAAAVNTTVVHVVGLTMPPGTIENP